MELSSALRIKYGLGPWPTDEEIQSWFRTTQNLIREGEPAEKAGELAAKLSFREYRHYIYKTQADNIEALLREAARK